MTGGGARWRRHPGEHNLHLPDLHEEVRRVADSFIHPNYTWNDKEYDIGLVSSLTTSP